MSEFQEKHTVSKLLGAPPGYSGYDDTSNSLSKILTNSSLVLFDEIEKAHTDVLTVLLQLFDEGRATDSKGQTKVCEDAIFIMTSNACENIFEANSELDYQDQLFQQDYLIPGLKKVFKRSEFIGRIDEIICFSPFSDTDLISICKSHLSEIRTALVAKGIKLSWSSEVVIKLKSFFIKSLGVRSLQHNFKKTVTNPVIKMLASNQRFSILKLMEYIDNSDCTE